MNVLSCAINRILSLLLDKQLLLLKDIAFPYALSTIAEADKTSESYKINFNNLRTIIGALLSLRFTGKKQQVHVTTSQVRPNPLDISATSSVHIGTAISPTVSINGAIKKKKKRRRESDSSQILQASGYGQSQPFSPYERPKQNITSTAQPSVIESSSAVGPTTQTQKNPEIVAPTEKSLALLQKLASMVKNAKMQA
jgi:hypothetical protein